VKCFDIFTHLGEQIGGKGSGLVGGRGILADQQRKMVVGKGVEK
jgi:hypothetical protein